MKKPTTTSAPKTITIRSLCAFGRPTLFHTSSPKLNRSMHGTWLCSGLHDLYGNVNCMSVDTGETALFGLDDEVILSSMHLSLIQRSPLQK